MSVDPSYDLISDNYEQGHGYIVIWDGIRPYGYTTAEWVSDNHYDAPWNGGNYRRKGYLIYRRYVASVEGLTRPPYYIVTIYKNPDALAGEISIREAELTGVVEQGIESIIATEETVKLRLGTKIDIEVGRVATAGDELTARVEELEKE